MDTTDKQFFGQRELVESNQKSKRNRRIWIALAVLVVAAAALLLLYGITATNAGFALPRRLKKLWAMVLVSVSIGFSSIVFQTLTHNRILTPSVMGLDSLYMLIQTVIVFFFGSRTLAIMNGNTEFLLSVGIMVALSMLLYQVLFRGEGKNAYFMVLVGMILGSLFGGLSTFMQVLIDPNEFSVLQGKMFASFNTINTELLTISTICVVGVMVYCYRDLPKLDVIALGRTQAISLGLDYNAVMRRFMCLIAVLISVSTVLVGPVTFLGIILANLSRTLLRTYRHKQLIAGSALIGIIALCGGQFVVEHVLNFSTTVGVIVNFVGGLYFFYMLIKESKQ